MKDKILQMGGKEWKKNGMSRVYIDNEILNKLLSERNSGEVNYGERNNKIFFDVDANAVMRSYKGKKPTVEIQY